MRFRRDGQLLLAFLLACELVIGALVLKTANYDDIRVGRLQYYKGLNYTSGTVAKSIPSSGGVTPHSGKQWLKGNAPKAQSVIAAGLSGTDGCNILVVKSFWFACTVRGQTNHGKAVPCNVEVQIYTRQGIQRYNTRFVPQKSGSMVKYAAPGPQSDVYAFRISTVVGNALDPDLFVDDLKYQEQCSK